MVEPDWTSLVSGGDGLGQRRSVFGGIEVAPFIGTHGTAGPRADSHGTDPIFRTHTVSAPGVGVCSLASGRECHLLREGRK